MGSKKPAEKKVKKFSFSKSLDRVSITIASPQVNEDGSVDQVEMEHCFKIDSLFDAMQAYRSALFVANPDGEPTVDHGAACFALWLETIEEVKNYDFTGVEDWKEFFKTNPVAREHAIQAANLLSNQLGSAQVKLSVPFGESGS
jgi:hypothetical protein